MTVLPPLDSLSSEQTDILILELFELVRSQAARIVELEAQVQALEAQLAKHSGNSGRPRRSWLTFLTLANEINYTDSSFTGPSR